MTIKARPRGLPQFEATVRELSAGRAAGEERAAKLRRPTGDLAGERSLLRDTIEELHVHQEELAVANEELLAQLDELRSATARIYAERDRYRTLFDLTPDSCFVTDSTGSIRDVNAAASRMLEIDARFLQGKSLSVLVDAADARMLREAMTALRSRPSFGLELRFKRRKSQPEWHTLKAVVLEADNAILWFARNVQAEHDTRLALATANYDARVAARSAHDVDLARANRDLEEMLARERGLRAELEAEHVAKDRFLSVLSRDLRAPLNAVLGWTQLLRRERLDHAARDRALATIERNAETELRLVEQLLDISRVGAGNVQVERGPLVLDDLVRQTVDAIAPSARERGIEIRARSAEERLIVAGDRRRLEQAISHLLRNAVQLTPRDGAAVEVEVKREGREARIVVVDHGQGIAEDQLAHVFDPFRQSVDYAANEHVGLGLYIVRQCVLLHGGSVRAESEGPGRGARFTVVLPLADAFALGADDAAASEARPANHRERTRALEGIRVLVVDDEDDMRELMTAILGHQGAIVTAAADADDALRAFDASPPDVVLSDIGLPGRTGLELARDLRSRPNVAATLIAVSGHAAPEQVDTALRAGFEFHVAKPVDPAELVSLIAEAARARMG